MNTLSNSMSLALRNSLGACKAESLIEIFLVYQIPLRDIVSKRYKN